MQGSFLDLPKISAESDNERGFVIAIFQNFRNISKGPPLGEFFFEFFGHFIVQFASIWALFMQFYH